MLLIVVCLPLFLLPCSILFFIRLTETTANCEHARNILQKQIHSALHIATDHKSAIEETLGSALEQVKDLQKTVLDMPAIE
jgi:hypothetical protein